MRTAFSEAIHRSIERSILKYKDGGKIAGIKPKNMTEARHLAAQAAYSRVKTEPGKSDTGKRTWVS